MKIFLWSILALILAVIVIVIIMLIVTKNIYKRPEGWFYSKNKNEIK